MKFLELSFLILFFLCIHKLKSQSLNHFVRVTNAFLDVPKQRWGEIVEEQKCADECLKRSYCLSFEMESGKCFFSGYVTSGEHKPKMKKHRDFFQLINPNQEYIQMKHATIPYKDDITQIRDLTFLECQEKCRKHPRCHSFEVKIMCKDCKRVHCNLATVNFLNHKLYPNNHGWSIYLSNPDYNNSKCDQTGPLKYVNIHIFDTDRDSEDTYKCFPAENQTAFREEAKSASYCSGSALNNFIRISHASLDAPKERWGGIIDKEACADECIKQSNCHSFEMESGKCFFLKDVTSDDHKPMKNEKRDFYQRIYPTQEYVPVKHSSIHSKYYLNETYDQSMTKCQEHCRKIPSCHLFEAKFVCKQCKHFMCKFSTENFKMDNVSPNADGWSIYFSNPNYNHTCSDPMKYANLNVFNSKVQSMAKYKCLPSGNIPDAGGKDGNLDTPVIF